MEYFKEDSVESLIEKLCDIDYRLGKIVQMEIVSHSLLEQSGKLFANSKDDMAKEYRKLGLDLTTTAKNLREKHTQEVSPLKTKIWEELCLRVHNIDKIPE